MAAETKYVTIKYATNPFVLTYTDVLMFRRSGQFEIEEKNISSCNFCKKLITADNHNDFSWTHIWTYSCKFKYYMPRFCKYYHLICDFCSQTNQYRYPRKHGCNENDSVFIVRMMEEDLKLYLLSAYNYFNNCVEFQKNLLEIEKVGDKEVMAFAVVTFNENIKKKFSTLSYEEETKRKAKDFQDLKNKADKMLQEHKKNFDEILDECNNSIKFKVFCRLKNLCNIYDTNKATFLFIASQTEMSLMNYKKEIMNYGINKPEKYIYDHISLSEINYNKY
jgi:hypothetical protein